MRTPFLLSGLVLLLAAVPSAVADDADAARAKWTAAALRFPAPAPDHAFVLEGDVVVESAALGRFRLSATPERPGGEDGPVLWHVDEWMRAGGFVEESEAWLTAELTPVRGRVHKVDEEGDRTQTWQREGDAYVVVTEGEGLEPRQRRVEASAPATLTLTAVALFGRLAALVDEPTAVLEENGTVAVWVFDPDWNVLLGERPFTVATFTLDGPGAWGDGQARLMRGTREDKSLEAAYDLETNDLLGLRLMGEGRPTVLLRPGTNTTAETFDFDEPAKTARMAALRAALSFAAADLAILDDVVHWPSALAAMQASRPGGEEVTVEMFRTAMLANLEQSLTERPRGPIEVALKGSIDTLETTVREDGTTVVRFPPIFRSMELVVGEVDGTWYLVELPSR